MKHSFACCTLAVLVVILALTPCNSSGGFSAASATERPAAVAGSFYPGDSTELRAFVDRTLSNVADVYKNKDILALVSPHAGYLYSGGVAAHSYALLKDRHFKRVIIIGPSHYESFTFSSVYNGNSFSTPLGKVPVDLEFARKLAKADSSIHMSSSGHSHGDKPEHSIEVQLPFLQLTLGDFSIVPIVMGDQSYSASRALGLALAKLLKDDHSTLLVASSDLSHYHTYDEANRMDRNLLGAIEQGDFLSVSLNTERRLWEACGAAPIVATMIAAERLGAANPHLLKYANSGDATNDRSRVVGYAALALFRETETAAIPKFSLTQAERDELLKTARLSVESAVRDRKPYEPPAPTSATLLQDRGVFVTLTKQGQLRGCIGYTAPQRPLYMSVRDTAIYAALRDPRFPQVKPDELKDLHYEISVLSPFHHVIDAKAVKVGQHGLLIRRDNEVGVLLPQVPVEQKWDRVTFLEEVALKAGLEKEAWRDEAADLFTFTALVFSDQANLE